MHDVGTCTYISFMIGSLLFTGMLSVMLVQPSVGKGGFNWYFPSTKPADIATQRQTANPKIPPANTPCK